MATGLKLPELFHGFEARLGCRVRACLRKKEKRERKRI